MAFYTEKRPPIEAIQFEDSSNGVKAVEEFCGEHVEGPIKVDSGVVLLIYSFKTQDHKAFAQCWPGNYIIKMTEGFRVLSAKEFREKYSPLYHINGLLF